MKKALKAAFPCTLPVMTGYLFVGFAFGILFKGTGQPGALSVLMSVAVYAGSMQFFAVKFMDGSFSILAIVLLTLLINSRHIFYGLPFIEKFKGMGRKKPYMVFSLTDETFSLLCSVKAPDGVDNLKFMFSIAILNQLYWVTGTALGSVAGSVLPFDTKGIDFAMTALFIVIAVEQWRASPTHIPTLAGIGATLAAMALFGRSNFILPAMVAMVAALMVLRRPVEKKLTQQGNNEKEEPCRAQDMP